MLALHISLICSSTLSFDQVHIKHNQPQNLRLIHTQQSTRFTKRRTQSKL